MSDPESFAARWSRLKHEAANKHQEAVAVQPATEPARASPAADTSAEAQSRSIRANVDAEPPFGPESLPPIDSITAGSDIKAFLRAGVPKHLTQAALRRAWTADPAIRDFIGLAENQWDFTDPAAIPGFGPLEATDDVRQLVAQAMGRLAHSTAVEDREDDAPASERAQVWSEPGEMPVALQPDNAVPEEKAPTDQRPVPEERQRNDDVADAQPATSTTGIGDVRGRRTHGGALPK